MTPRRAAILAAGWSFLLAAERAPGADLSTQPPGVHVSLRGRVTLSGVTPLPLEDLPPGSYRLMAQGLGTLQARGRLLRGGSEVRVERAVGPGALVWPPGLKHLDQAETGRGLMFMASGAGMGTMALVNEGSRSSAAQSVDQAQRVYDAAVSEEAILDARLDLAQAQDEESKEQEMRNLYAGYLGLIWIGAAVEAWLLTPQPSLSEGHSLTVPAAGGASAGLRSLLVPGAGQRSLGHSGRGTLFTAAVIGMGTITMVAHEAYLQSHMEQADAQRRYSAAQTEAELERALNDLEDAAETADGRNSLRWALAGATAGVYLWNVLDAWALGKRAHEAGPLNLSLLPSPGGVQAGLTWRIS